MSAPVYLAQDVCFSVTGDHGVFLDLRKDEYSAVKLAAAPYENATDCGLQERLVDHLETLLEAGLLTRDGGAGSPLSGSRKIAQVAAHVFGVDDTRRFGVSGEGMDGDRITPRDMFDFVAAFGVASRRLKHWPIHAVVSAVRARKGEEGKGCDLVALRHETAKFCRLRPWYPHNYLCLRDSLALVAFLSRRKLYPTWVFAVRMMPFGAHCWVQAGTTLLNDDSEYTAAFTPIMAV